VPPHSIPITRSPHPWRDRGGGRAEMTAQTAAAVCVLFLLARGALSEPPASIWVRPMGDVAAGDVAPADADEGSADDLPVPIM
jgi:hypothetical protein